jgi:hypothetical protein
VRQRGVALSGHCNERCTLRAVGSLLGTGAPKRPQLKGTVTDALPNLPARLQLRLTGRALRYTRRALARGRRVTARVRVSAKDSAGNFARVIYKRIRISG